MSGLRYWLNRMRRSLRRIPEVLAVGLAFVFIPLIPRFVLVAMARQLGRLAFILSRRDRRVALANLDLVFGESLTGREKAALARVSFTTFAQTVLDVFWFAWWTRSRIMRYVDYAPDVEEVLTSGPAIFVTAHYGNWEVMGQSAACRGYPLTSVAKPLSNPILTGMLNRLRASTGQRIVPAQGAIRMLMKTLQAGGSVALLLDQEVPVEQGGVWIDFFGVPVLFSNAAASLAARLRCPVVPVFCVCGEDGMYRVRCMAPLAMRNGRGDATPMTRLIVHAMETEIRRNPGAWLWMYKRWKRMAPGVMRDRYPDYADCY